MNQKEKNKLLATCDGLPDGLKVPDYFRDLNAISDIQDKLDPYTRRDYLDLLESMADDRKVKFIWFAASAPAGIRAEFIGQALGLWKARNWRGTHPKSGVALDALKKLNAERKRLAALVEDSLSEVVP